MVLGCSGSDTDTTNTTDVTDTTDSIDVGVVVPDGWTGPLAMMEAPGDGAAPDCGGEPVLLAFRDLSADDAVCSCGCGEPTETVQCPEFSTLDQYESHTVNCNLQSVAQSFEVEEGCNDVPFFDDVAFKLTIPDLDLEGVSCVPEPAVELPTAVWGQQLAVCELGPDAPTEARTCISRQGDAICPEGDYVQRVLAYRDLEDERSCTACTCGDAEGACGATVTLKGGESCAAGGPDEGPEDTCLTSDTPTRSVELEYNGPDLTCEGSAVEAEGEVQPADPVTLCCL